MYNNEIFETTLSPYLFFASSIVLSEKLFDDNKGKYIQSKRRKTLARVSKSKELEIDTDSNDFSFLPKKEKEDLFSLIIEYAMTPLDERVDEDGY